VYWHSLTECTQETAKLEAQAYELEQKTALAAEAKSVLDSWVRYEGQVKARQQRELAETIISKIEKQLQDPKVLKQILDQSVADVESKSLIESWSLPSLTSMRRDYLFKSCVKPFQHRQLPEKQVLVEKACTCRCRVYSFPPSVECKSIKELIFEKSPLILA